MLDTPQILHTEDQLTAVIPITVPRDEIMNVMGPGLDELETAVAAQGVAITGPWFTHHFRMDPDVFDFEICLPVTTAITPMGRAHPGRIPAAKVARTIYRGPYEGLGKAWSDFMDWIEAQGLTPREDLWEVYITGPESGPDPATWQTQLNRPLL